MLAPPGGPPLGEAEKVVAIAYYEAQDEWQLTLYENDIITVTDKYINNPEYEGKDIPTICVTCLVT